MKKCSQCGWENADSNGFCINCNAELEQTVSNTVKPSVNTERFDKAPVIPTHRNKKTKNTKKGHR